ncbi:MAG: DUF805 domain-containing protein [Rhodobacteraceae bacterium]|nr:DUF805 domain-containing protein [Paracoccaceae bacterium]
MTFTESVSVCLIKKYAIFTGRATRSEYWWFFLFTALANSVAGALFGELASIVSLALLLPGLAAACRRLHDAGRSGWWLLLILIPFVGWIALIIMLVQPSTDREWV